MLQQKKILKHSQDHSELFLLKIPPSPQQKHQNHMSEFLHTCIVTIDFNFIGVLGPKSQDLVIPFRRGEGETLLDFHLIDLTVRSELGLMPDQKGKIKNLTSKYIM